MEIIGDDDGDDEAPKQMVRVDEQTDEQGIEDTLARVRVSENIEAVHIFSRVGSIAETSRQTGISTHALYKMSREAWWQRELLAIHREEVALENVRLSRLYSMTLEQIENKLENGEEVFNRHTGDVDMVPIGADTLVRIGRMLFEHRQLVREAPTQIVGEQGSNKLEKLAEKLEKLGQIRGGGVIDIDEEGNVIEQKSVGEGG